LLDLILWPVAYISDRLVLGRLTTRPGYLSSWGRRETTGSPSDSVSRRHGAAIADRSTIILVDPLRTGARLLSRGMRGGNGALTLLGALLAARGVLRWLERPDRELLYSKRLKPGQRLEIRVPEED